MWYYRTEVRNTTNVPLRVTRFEAYHQAGGQWVAGNIMGRSLTSQDFSDWYRDGDLIVDGVIPPGGVGIDARNWHGSQSPTAAPTKWAYWAVDPSGVEHYAEAVIESVPMARRKAPILADWFGNCGGWRPRHDLSELQRGIEAGLLDEQDEYGMTGLSLAVMSGWNEGVEELLRAKANTELRYFRTGETALHMAVQERKEPMIAALIEAGANPDAANYWGLTPRAKLPFVGLRPLFDNIPQREVRLPPPLIQNAEHLADHYHPEFKIPDREERETMQVGQAVDLYVYGPKTETKQDTVKVRITGRSGRRPQVLYTASVETPIERTHLEGTTVVEFGPESIASVYVPRPGKK